MISWKVSIDVVSKVKSQRPILPPSAPAQSQAVGGKSKGRRNRPVSPFPPAAHRRRDVSRRMRRAPGLLRQPIRQRPPLASGPAATPRPASWRRRADHARSRRRPAAARPPSPPCPAARPVASARRAGSAARPAGRTAAPVPGSSAATAPGGKAASSAWRLPPMKLVTSRAPGAAVCGYVRLDIRCPRAKAPSAAGCSAPKPASGRCKSSSAAMVATTVSGA